MRVLVIGGGVIGVTTAYELGRRGHEVIVLDRRKGPGLETSFANGGLLTPSMAEPWNAPGSWRVLLGSLCRSDAPLQLRLGALPSLGTWGVRFLRNARPSAFEQNTLSNLRLSLYSIQALEALRAETAIHYGYSGNGCLRLFREAESLRRATFVAERRASEGLSFRRLSTQETVALEPALAPVADELAGALHYPIDEVGDAYLFCTKLTELARMAGVEFRFGVEVSRFELKDGRIAAAVVAAQERLIADRYVIAAGSYSAPFLERIGISLPVRPVKGYSVTFDRLAAEGGLRLPLVDDDLHAVVVPINGAIRVAGTAEFTGYDQSPNARRIGNLTGLLRKVLPKLSINAAAAKPWCGLRAMSADGVPIIGPTPIEDLWVNTGHGHLGWTMAVGSAHLLADLMCGCAPTPDPAPFALSRFARSIF